MMNKRPRRPSIRDVARIAGVSHQTVSRVLNSPELVRPDTRAAIEATIQELGYRRSHAARTLATNDSRVLGVISVRAALFGPVETVYAIEEGARARNYATVRITLEDDSRSSLREVRDHLLDLAVDGVIVLAWSEASLEMAESFADTLPTCVIAEGDAPAGMSRVRGDHFGGAVAATAALVRTGCRTIGHLAGPADWLEAQARRQGWSSIATGPCVEAGWSAADGYRAMSELWERAPSIDGLFAANDRVAIGAMKWLADHHRSVPGDVAIIGFDDTDVAGFLPIPLASVRQPFRAVGEAAVRAFFDLISGGSFIDETIPTQLIMRSSAKRDRDREPIETPRV